MEGKGKRTLRLWWWFGERSKCVKHELAFCIYRYTEPCAKGLWWCTNKGINSLVLGNVDVSSPITITGKKKVSVISQPIVMSYAIPYGSENTKHKYVSEYDQIAFVTCSRY